MAANISFARIMKKGDMTAMAIPGAVYDKYSTGALRGTVVLELAGNTWQVEVGSGSLTAGWKQFWTDNGLKEGDSLIFHHLSGRRFSVELYSSDGSVKDAMPAGDSADDVKELAESIEKVIKECVVHLDDKSSLKFVVTKVPRVDTDAAEDAFTPKKTTAANGPSSRTRSSPRTAPPAGARAVETRKKKKKEFVSDAEDEEGRSAKRARTLPSKKETTREARSSRRKSRVVSKLSVVEVISEFAAGKEVGDSSNTLAKATETKSPVKKPKKSPARKAEKTSSAKKQLVPVSSSPALAQAQAVTTSNPSTVIVMKKSNIAPCFYLNVPMNFAKRHLPEDVKEFDMIDSTNKAWAVRWLGSPKRAFSGGWCYFAQDHNLALNDVCVLEIVNDSSVKVSIFRGDQGKQLATVPAAEDDQAVHTADEEDDGLGQAGAVDVDAVVDGIAGDKQAQAAPPEAAADDVAMTGGDEDEADDNEADDEDYDPKNDAEEEAEGNDS